jgi:hypothetical protein
MSKSATRSLSPHVRRDITYEDDVVRELLSKIQSKDSLIKNLESTINELESQHPAVQEIVRSRIECERAVFEERSEKVSLLLNTKK